MEAEVAEERTQEEVDRVLNECAVSEMEGSRWPAATYEQGVKEALMWIMGQVGNPMDD